MLHNDLIRHGLEFARAIDRRQFEMGPNGLYFPKQKAVVAGQFRTWVNGCDMQIDPNIVPAEGLARILKSGINGTSWYIAPFLNDVTLTSALTAANFHSTLNEFDDYDEANRVAWTIPTDPVSGAYTNEASPSVFTAAAAVGTDPGVDVIGAGILSSAAKQATTGVLLCASKFAGARNLKTPDKLTVEYSIQATSA